VIDNVRSPGAVAIGDAGVYVLAGRVTGIPICPIPTHTALVRLDLAAGTAGAERDTGVPGRDLAVEIGGLQRIFVTDPCGGAVLAFSQLETGGPGTKLFDAPMVRALTLVGRKLLAAGAVGPNNPNGSIYSYDLDSGQLATLNFQMPDERYQLPITAVAQPGQSVELRVEPDRIDVYDLSISPDANRAMVLAHTYFHQDPINILGLAASDIDAYYVLLIDLQSGAVLSRVRADCTVKVAGDPAAYVCDPAVDSIVPDSEFTPTSTAILWGWQ
jgi:hypothetical protein